MTDRLNTHDTYGPPAFSTQAILTAYRAAWEITCYRRLMAWRGLSPGLADVIVSEGGHSMEVPAIIVAPLPVKHLIAALEEKAAQVHYTWLIVSPHSTTEARIGFAQE